MSLHASMGFNLYPFQEEALAKLKSGSVLYGKVGSGKSLTALSYFLKTCKKDTQLFIITTARKRDTLEWEKELELVGIDNFIVDSWNNIKKYTDVRHSFFIFDEQRVVGYGAWSKSFFLITQKNKWLMLTGTPGDTWIDYMTLFIANGFYKNKTEFIENHVEYDRFAKFPKIKKYHKTGLLEKYRKRILVSMEFERRTFRHRIFLECSYDEKEYGELITTRLDPEFNKPIKNASRLTQLLRKMVATSDGRVHEACWQLCHLDKVIVFYNYNYELDILRDLCEFIGKPCAEWNGHKHEEIPDTDDWAYLVQYTSGAEGWNCIETNKVLFYSPNYSYKITEQAEGRIDRLNTPFTDLYYYYLTSDSSIDKSVLQALSRKKKFNSKAWADSLLG